MAVGPRPLPQRGGGPDVAHRAERHIAADPTSLALLLAGPAALELWPGFVRHGRVGELVTAGVQTVAGHRDIAVTALPPRRTATAFVAEFRVRRADGARFPGRLTLGYDGAGTRACLDLDAELAVLVPGQAEAFLANLAATAEQRPHDEPRGDEPRPED